MKRIVLASLLLLALPSLAWGQGQVSRGCGTARNGHAAVWSQDRVICDADMSGSALIGVPPGAGLLDLPLVGPLALFDGPNTQPYHSALFSWQSGTFTLNLSGQGGATSPNVFNVVIGGVTYPFPSSGSANVVGPPSSTASAVALFNGTGGKLLADGTSMLEVFTPLIHPQTGGVNSVSDYMAFTSGDCTTHNITVTVTGTPTTGESPGFNYNNGSGLNTNVTYTVVGGDTNNTIAAGLLASFKANSTIRSIFNTTCPDGVPVGDGTANTGIIFNANVAANLINFNQFYPEASAASTTPINSAHTTITVGSQGDKLALETNPSLGIGRKVTGRPARATDLLGQIVFIGKDLAGNDQQYGLIAAVITDPNAATAAGYIAIGTNTTANASTVAFGKGIWNAGTTDPGAGTFRLGGAGASAAADFMAYNDIGTTFEFAQTGTGQGSRGMIRENGTEVISVLPTGQVGFNLTNPTLPFDFVAANSGNGQMRVRYDGVGAGLLINQVSSGGAVSIVNVGNANLVLGANNANVEVISPLGQTTFTGTTQPQLIARYDSNGAGFTVGQAASAGAVTLLNAANANLLLGANNIPVETIGANGQTIFTGTVQPQLAVRFDSNGAALTIGQASSGGNVSIYNAANASLFLGSNNATQVTISPGVFNLASGTVYQANGTAGVTCAGAPTGSFASTSGIVTHC